MNICKSCIESLHPDYFKTVDPDSIPWSRATCHHCSAKSEFVIVATKEMLDNPQPVPPQPSRQKRIIRKAKKAVTEPQPTDQDEIHLPWIDVKSLKVASGSEPIDFESIRKEKLEYVIIDWAYEPNLYFCVNKDALVKKIEHTVFTLGHKNIEVYRLTPLPHKAEIKIEVGE